LGLAANAVVFVDGSNWYHSLRAAGVTNIGKLDLARVSRKLVQQRRWKGTR